MLISIYQPDSCFPPLRPTVWWHHVCFSISENLTLMQRNWCKKCLVWGITELVEMKSFIDFSWKERWPYTAWSCNHGSRSSHGEKKNDAAFTAGGGNGHSELNVFKPVTGSLRHFYLICFDFGDGLCCCIPHRRDIRGKRTHSVIGPQQHQEAKGHLC